MKVTLFILVLAAAQLAQADDTPTNYLTLAQARELALKQHPKISVANLTALAARQVTKEVQSAMLPSIFGYATAVDNADPNNTRIAAGGLNNPLIYEREAQGVSISQLITDFGRSWDLTKSAGLRERSEQMNVDATRAQIPAGGGPCFLLDSGIAVSAGSRPGNRQQQSIYLLEQIQALADQQDAFLELDVSFASVDYGSSQGSSWPRRRVMCKSSFAVFADVLGESRSKTYHLSDEPSPAYVTNNYSGLILEALAQRPDLAQARYQRDAAKEYARAQAKLNYPTISAAGHRRGDCHGQSSSWPRLRGGRRQSDTASLRGRTQRFGSSEEAQLRGKAAQETVRDQENNIARDVQVTKASISIMPGNNWP